MSVSTLQRYYHSIFHEPFSNIETSPSKIRTYRLLEAVHNQSLEKVILITQEILAEDKKNAAFLMGKARFLAEKLPQKRIVAFLSDEIHRVLEREKMDKRTFFRDLYMQRLRYQSTAPSPCSPSQKSLSLKMQLLTVFVVVAYVGGKWFVFLRSEPVKNESSSALGFKDVQQELHLWNQSLAHHDVSLQHYENFIDKLGSAILSSKEITQIVSGAQVAFGTYLLEMSGLTKKFNDALEHLRTLFFQNSNFNGAIQCTRFVYPFKLYRPIGNVTTITKLNKEGLCKAELREVEAFFKKLKKMQESVHSSQASLRNKVAHAPPQTPLSKLQHFLMFQINQLSFNIPRILPASHRSLIEAMFEKGIKEINGALIKIAYLFGRNLNDPLDGKPPLLLAFEKKDPSILKMLLDLGATSYIKNEKGYYLIVQAAIEGDTLAYELLKKASGDIFLSPFEQEALESKRRGTLDHLIQESGTLLHQEASQGQDRNIRFLLELGANPKILNKNLLSPLCLYRLVQGRLPPKELMSEDDFCHYFLATKYLSHAWEFRSSIEIRGIKVDLEASYPTFMAEFMLGALTKFQSEYGAFNPKEFLILKQFLNGVVMNGYQSPHLKVIPSGYPGHAVQMVVLKHLNRETLLIANKGENSRAPLEIYEFPQNETLSLHDFTQMKTFSTSGDYIAWLNQFPGHLGTKTHALALKILKKFPLKAYQPQGNCAWESSKTAIYGLTSLLREGEFGASDLFTLFHQYTLVDSLEHFLSVMKSETIIENKNMFEVLFDLVSRWKWDPFLKARLKRLNHKYQLITS